MKFGRKALVRMVLRKDGWQCWVEIYNDHVLKRFKNRDEIKERVYRHLERKGKLELLEETIDKMIEDVKYAKRVLKRFNQRDIFAGLEFLEEGLVKQKRVVPLGEFIVGKKHYEREELLKGAVDFLVELWGYGIHEKTFKFLTNYGFDGERIVLIDPFEITGNKRKVLRQITKKPWAKKSYRELSEEERDYLVSYMDEVLNKETLEKVWRRS